MNIFWLDTNLEKCAKYHCDKHVVKMPIEYAQILSAVALHNGFTAPYAETHKNHPCTVWAREYNGNYALLYKLAVEVGKEYTRRYGRVHKSTLALEELPEVINDEVVEVSPLPNCTTIKEGNLNLVDKYRLYYMRDKAHILTYKNTEEPPWMGDRFYQQQLKTLGTCPGDGKDKKPKAPRKDELLMGISGLKALTLPDLVVLSNLSTWVTLTLPEGRLKAPYVAELNKLEPSINWTKLTVATLKEIINLSCQKAKTSV